MNEKILLTVVFRTFPNLYDGAFSENGEHLEAINYLTLEAPSEIFDKNPNNAFQLMLSNVLPPHTLLRGKMFGLF